MNGIEVRYKHGTQIVNSFKAQYGYLTAQQVDQILEKIRPELHQIAGAYKWQLERCLKGYTVRAYYTHLGHREFFTEAFGDTPGQALRNFQTARQILVNNYNFS